ncbi:hypothetical protein ACFVIM_22225 [Streptomyces sp. NPDC057638]|uniref:hypothetical protein n=1 Tax=Streptomyces sp. NPDC057638 TaxID=3346190 RepID=UPI0036C0194A
MNETPHVSETSETYDCQVCDDLVAAERDARVGYDHSRAADCRVLLRRHMDGDHGPLKGR